MYYFMQEIKSLDSHFINNDNLKNLFQRTVCALSLYVRIYVEREINFKSRASRAGSRADPARCPSLVIIDLLF